MYEFDQENPDNFQVATARASGPLDKSDASLLSPPRSDACQLRRRQRNLTRDAHKSLSLCGIAVIGNPKLATARLEVTTYEGKSHHARITGTQTCHSPWSCPVCAPRIASQRAAALQPQIVAKLADGWTAWLITLTVSHERGDDLGAMFKGLSKAWGGVTSGKGWKSRSDRGLEWTRGYDITYSQGAGWHPHIHLFLLLGPRHEDAEATANWIANRWQQCAGRAGFVTDEKAQDVQRCYDPEKAARYATTSASVFEVVGSSKKNSAKSSASRTPFEILRRAVNGRGSPADRALWLDYVVAVKGKRQVTTSKGLFLTEDDDIDEGKDSSDSEESPEPDVVAEISQGVLLGLDEDEKLDELLAVVSCSDLEQRRSAALKVLRDYPADGWKIISPELSPDSS